MEIEEGIEENEEDLNSNENKDQGLSGLSKNTKKIKKGVVSSPKAKSKGVLHKMKLVTF